MSRVFFWIREIAGWCLVGAAIFLFVVCLSLVGQRKVVEAGIVTAIGIFLFRGGLSLVKMSTAARVLIADQASSSDKSKRLRER